MTVESLPSDPAFPQMSRLLDVEAMAPVLSAMVGDGVTLDVVRLEYLRYRPGKRLVACFAIDAPEGGHQVMAVAEPGADLAARAREPRNLRLARRVSSRGKVATPLGYDGELDVLIQWSPVDIEIPALALPIEMLREELVLAGVELGTDEVPTLLKHKPQNRVVMRLDRTFLKIYASASAFAAAVHGIHKAAGAPVTTSRCEGIVPGLRIVAQSAVSGRPPEDDAALAPRAGALLRRLHAAGIGGLPLERPAAVLEDVRGDVELLATLVPSLADRLAPLLRRLESELPDEPLVACHGGFRRSQLLADGGEIAVIDFDGFCRAPAASDLASFTAALVEGPDDLEGAAVTLDALLGGYGARPGGIPWYLSTSLLKRARRPFTRLENAWPEAIAARVRAAELALEV